MTPPRRARRLDTDTRVSIEYLQKLSIGGRKIYRISGLAGFTLVRIHLKKKETVELYELTDTLDRVPQELPINSLEKNVCNN